MYKIYLENLSIHARHGLFEEESVYGNEFVIDAVITTKNKPVHKLEDTVDYVKVYEIIRSKFGEPNLLLEKLAKNLSDNIAEIDSDIIHVSIRIRKLMPPIEGFNGTVSVSYESNY